MNYTTKIIIWLNLMGWAIFFIAFWNTGFFATADGSVWAKSLGTWADGAAHLTYISAMAYRTPHDLPTYLGKPFVYPFVADGLSAILVRMGMDIFVSYDVVGMVLSLVLLLVLFCFYAEILKHKVAAVISLNLFLLSGGVGYIKFFRDWWQRGGEVLKAIPQEYTLIDEWKIRWINIVTAELIPQRAFLLAIPLMLIVAYWHWLMLNQKKVSLKLTLCAAIVFGCMPVIHPHSYITFVFLSGWFFVVGLVPYWSQLRQLKLPNALKHWLVFGGISALISLPILFLHILPASDRSFIQWWLGWLARSNKINWLWWWFVNTGLFFPLAILGWLQMKHTLRIYLFGFWIVFAICNIVIFQPYDWDNSKIITWCILGLSPAVATLLTKYWHKGFLGVVASSLLFVSLTLAGFIDVVRQLQPHVNIPMYSPEQLEIAAWVKQNTAPDSIFVTGQSHVHVISTLTGRQIVMGFQGWLWSYGIDYSIRERQITDLYKYGNFEMLKTYDVDYAAVGPNEISTFQFVEDPFAGRFELVKRTDNYKIYDVKGEGAL